jgi:predicted phage tail protein
MRIVFHGILRQLFGDDAHMQADTVAEALEGYSRQVDWPTEVLVHVVGFDTPEKFQNHADEVHLMPAMHGGGGKFGSIILGAITVVAGVLLLETPFGIPLIISGSLMVVQGVIGLFLKAPKMKGVDDPESSKYLPVNKNTTAIGTPITLAYGRIDLAGHWLSLQSDSNNLSYGVFPANP